MSSPSFATCSFGVLGLVVGCATGAPPPTEDPAYQQADTGQAPANWSHVQLTSAEGTVIRIDYQLTQATSGNTLTTTATPLWLNVQRGDLASAGGVHVWMQAESWFPDSSWAEVVQYHDFQDGSQYNVDLSRSGDATRFTAQIAGGLVASTYLEGDDKPTLDAYQLAIEIDGVWQTDPVSGTHNFWVSDLEGY